MAYSATEDDVDVMMSGFAFRLRILHERGLTLLKNESKVILLSVVSLIVWFINLYSLL